MSNSRPDADPGELDRPRIRFEFRPRTDERTARRFAVVDVETTGLDPARDRILQIAAILINDNGDVLDTFDSVVRPESPSEYEHGAEHVHGITPDEVRNGMPLGQAIERLKQISSNAVFTAHNARFDLGFLAAEASRVGAEWTVNSEEVVDTLKLSRSLDATREYSHRLTDLCERYGIVRDRAHNAYSDALATAQLLTRFLSDSPDILDEPSPAATTSSTAPTSTATPTTERSETRPAARSIHDTP